MEFFEEHSQTIIEMLLVYAPQLLLAIIVLVVGCWLLVSGLSSVWLAC